MIHRRVEKVPKESWSEQAFLRPKGHCMQTGNNFLVLYSLYFDSLPHSLIFGCVCDNNITILKESASSTSSF